MKRNNSKEQSPIENAIAKDFTENRVSVYFNSGYEVSLFNQHNEFKRGIRSHHRAANEIALCYSGFCTF